MRAVRRAVLAAAVTTGVVAFLRRPAAGSTQPAPAPVPQQRRSGLDDLGLRVADLVVPDEEARDARLWQVLDRARRSPGC
jgi:hypothetical protein